ncbi:MAG: HEPN domain-containing protein [Chloroflexota bacterium]
MKNPKETARRWLAQAEHSLDVTQVLLAQSLWPEVCFHAEQTAQLALKAYLFLEGRRFINVHSIRALAEECNKYDATFTPIIDYGRILDRYYLATRYPDVLPPPAVPFESFTEPEAHQALDYATEIVELARARISREPRR